ncbi:hypothetical protein K449DRAFT_465332 [Hypoxylon sp. EC38]|nr:hypothetical protein K449DRAFT_465332 [Hypoxylon sp. EC38]
MPSYRICTPFTRAVVGAWPPFVIPWNDTIELIQSAPRPDLYCQYRYDEIAISKLGRISTSRATTTSGFRPRPHTTISRRKYALSLPNNQPLTPFYYSHDFQLMGRTDYTYAVKMLQRLDAKVTLWIPFYLAILGPATITGIRNQNPVPSLFRYDIPHIYKFPRPPIISTTSNLGTGSVSAGVYHLFAKCLLSKTFHRRYRNSQIQGYDGGLLLLVPESAELGDPVRTQLNAEMRSSLKLARST